MRYNILAFFCLLMHISGCGNRSEKDNNNDNLRINDHIVLIVDRSPGNSTYKWPDGVVSGNTPSYEIRYIDDNRITRLFTPKLSPFRDTLVLKTKRERIEVQHAYLGIDNLSYIFCNGDSVLFTYQGQEPIATVLNREVRSLELNFDLMKRKYISEGRFPGIIRVHPRFAFRDTTFKKIEDLNERVKVARRAGIKKALEEFKTEIKWLNELKMNHQISSEAYYFFKSKSVYNIAALQIEPELWNQNNSRLNQTEINVEDHMEEIPDMYQLISGNVDSLTVFFHFQNLVDQVYYKYMTGKVGSIKSTFFINGIPEGGANYPDYRSLYDTLKDDTILNEDLKKVLLFKTIDALIPQSSLEDIEFYIRKFKEDVKDSAMMNYLTDKFQLSYIHKGKDSYSRTASDLYLRTINNEEQTFNEMLFDLKGKLVYVDYWASGCAPCIKEFPYSKKLQKSYSDKDVVFVYLSRDTEYDMWKRAVVKYGLDRNEHNYIIANQYTSKQLKELNVEYIPRYMLYDKNGILVQDYAPRPSDEKLIGLLDQYLAE